LHIQAGYFAQAFYYSYSEQRKMQPKKIILVFGATGAQGGSVAESLLNQDQFTVRIFTRHPNSWKAIALANAGAEIAAGDLNDITSISRALKGVYGVFGVTDYFEHSVDEYILGKNLIAAVSQSNVQHFVYSSRPGYHKLSGGALPVPQCDLKWQLEKYIRSLDLPFTFVRMSFYFENFINRFPLKEDKQGNLHFAFPQGNSNMAMASVADMGGIVSAIFNHPLHYIGRTVGIAAEDRLCSEYAYILSKGLQRNVYYTPVTHAEFAASSVPGAEELANMFEVQRLYIPKKQIDLIESYGLHPQMQSFETWIADNRNRLLKAVHTYQLSSVNQK